MPSRKHGPDGPSLPAAALVELNELLWALPTSRDPREIAAVLVERCSRMFQSPLACVWLVGETDHELAAVYGFSAKKAEQIWAHLSLAATNAHSLHLCDAADAGLLAFGKRRLGALLAIPLQSRGGLEGWLVLARLERQSYSDLEQHFASLIAGRVAAAIENAHLYRELERTVAERTANIQSLYGQLAQRMTDGKTYILGLGTAVQADVTAARQELAALRLACDDALALSAAAESLAGVERHLDHLDQIVNSLFARIELGKSNPF